MASEVKSLTNEELVQKLADREHELVRARFSHSMNQLENTASLGNIRRDIAQMKNEARSREIAGALPKGSLLAKKGSVGKAEQDEAQQAGSPEKRGFLKRLVDRITAKE